MAVQPEEVEDHERDGDLLRDPLDLALVLQVHPLLEGLERRPALGVDRHDLAVEHRVHLVDELVDHVDVRVLERDVAAPAGPEHRAAGLHLREGADPVELRFEPPRRIVERLPAALGQHRLEPGRVAIGERRVLGGGEEREPVGPRLHEVELDAGVATAVELEAHLRVGPLDRLVPAVVEDPNLAGAVVPFGDRPLERAVLERMDLGLHREPLVALRGSGGRGGPPRTRGRPRARAGRRSGAGSRDACGSRRSCPCPAHRRARARSCPVSPNSRLPDVLVERRVLRCRHDLLLGLPASWSSPRFAGVVALTRGSSSSSFTPERLEGVREVHLLRANAREQVSALPRTGPTRCRSGSPAARSRLRTPRPT